MQSLKNRQMYSLRLGRSGAEGATLGRQHFTSHLTLQSGRRLLRSLRQDQIHMQIRIIGVAELSILPGARLAYLYGRTDKRDEIRITVRVSYRSEGNAAG